MSKPVSMVSSYVVGWVEQMMEGWSTLDALESPIEKALFGAIWVMHQIDGEGRGMTGPVTIATPQRGMCADLLRTSDRRGCLNIALQETIGRYRVDMLITSFNEVDQKWHNLVIECDGHDFHERTKDQAKRDRARDRTLQEQGYTVYRFTGSEIHNDPVKCVHQIFEWVMKHHWASAFADPDREPS